MRHWTAWKSPNQVTLTALLWGFIRTIFTVKIPITLPSAGDTLAVVAHEVRLRTRLLHYKSVLCMVQVEITYPRALYSQWGQNCLLTCFIPHPTANIQEKLKKSFFFSPRGERWSFERLKGCWSQGKTKVSHYLTPLGYLIILACFIMLRLSNRFLLFRLFFKLIQVLRKFSSQTFHPLTGSQCNCPGAIS